MSKSACAGLSPLCQLITLLISQSGCKAPWYAAVVPGVANSHGEDELALLPEHHIGLHIQVKIREDAVDTREGFTITHVCNPNYCISPKSAGIFSCLN